MNLKFKKEQKLFGINNSFLNNSWVKSTPNSRLSLNISQKYSLTNIVSNILSTRGIEIDEIKRYLKPDLEKYLPNSEIFNDLKKGADRVFKAINNKEKIAILGDYDVDGLCSTSMLKKYFNCFNLDSYTYIPDRLKEGYGPNLNSIDLIKSKENTLLILVDCGTNAHDVIKYIKKKEIDLIIIDHHKSYEKHNDVLAFINPNNISDTSGYNFLCSAGLTFLFINCLQKMFVNSSKFSDLPDINMFLDLVALATVCDVVPLIDINRSFVYNGLKILSKRQNMGLKILSDENHLNKKPDEEDLGFFFGPRLNAGGRVGKSNIGEQLLCSNNEDEAEFISKKLNTLNYQRKLIEEKVYNESVNKIKENKLNKQSLFLYDNNWHEGVIGIVASRIKEKYKKPVIILTKNNDIYKGSGRSILGIDIGLLIIEAKQKKIIINGGGHHMAAGLSIKEKNINLFETFFEDYVKKNKKKVNNNNYTIIDEVLSLGAINDELIDNLEIISPFGIGNPKPKFIFHNVKIIKPNLIGESKNHLSFFITDETKKTVKAILFNATDNEIDRIILNSYKKNLFSFVGFVKKSIWKNKSYFEVIIEDGVLGKDII